MNYIILVSLIFIMMNLIIEESEHHMPFTVEQKELLEKLNKKLVSLS